MHNCSSLSLPKAEQSHIWLLLAPFPSFCLLLLPFFPLSPLQSLFSLESLASPAESYRGRQSKSEHIEYTGGNRRGLTDCVQGFYLTTLVMSHRWDSCLRKSSQAFLAKWGSPWGIICEATSGRRRCRAAADQRGVKGHPVSCWFTVWHWLNISPAAWRIRFDL